MAHQLEGRIVEQMGDVAAGAGEKIVDAEHVMTFAQQALAQEAAEKSGTARHEHALRAESRHDAPEPRTTTKQVLTRMIRSTQADQFLMYQLLSSIRR